MSFNDIFPSIGHHSKDRLGLIYMSASHSSRPDEQQQSNSNVRAIRSRATGARHRHRRICESSLLKWKHWP